MPTTGGPRGEPGSTPQQHRPKEAQIPFGYERRAPTGAWPASRHQARGQRAAADRELVVPGVHASGELNRHGHEHRVAARHVLAVEVDVADRRETVEDKCPLVAGRRQTTLRNHQSHASTSTSVPAAAATVPGTTAGTQARASRPAGPSSAPGGVEDSSQFRRPFPSARRACAPSRRQAATSSSPGSNSRRRASRNDSALQASTTSAIGPAAARPCLAEQPVDIGAERLEAGAQDPHRRERVGVVVLQVALAERRQLVDERLAEAPHRVAGGRCSRLRRSVSSDACRSASPSSWGPHRSARARCTAAARPPRSRRSGTRRGSPRPRARTSPAPWK